MNNVNIEEIVKQVLSGMTGDVYKRQEGGKICKIKEKYSWLFLQ